MNKYKLRQLVPADRKIHEEMSRKIVSFLPREEFLIPMTPEEYEDTFVDGSQDIVYGLFDNGQLIATSALLHDTRAYAEQAEVADILTHRCTEIGECMVLPEYRGRNLMLRLNELVKAEALRQGMHYMLATAHPDNIASNSSLCRLGYHIVKEFTRAGKRRNLLLMEL